MVVFVVKYSDLNNIKCSCNIANLNRLQQVILGKNLCSQCV